MTPTSVLSSLLAAGMLAGMPASSAKAGPAPNLTGTWVGKYACANLIATGKLKDKMSPSIIEITHVSDSEVRMLLDGSFQYNGFALGLAAKPTDGAVTFVECRTNPADPDFNEVISVTVSATPEKGKLKGPSAWNNDTNNVGGTCKFSFKRTSTADPGVGPGP